MRKIIFQITVALITFMFFTKESFVIKHEVAEGAVKVVGGAVSKPPSIPSTGSLLTSTGASWNLVYDFAHFAETSGNMLVTSTAIYIGFSNDRLHIIQ